MINFCLGLGFLVTLASQIFLTVACSNQKPTLQLARNWALQAALKKEDYFSLLDSREMTICPHHYLYVLAFTLFPVPSVVYQQLRLSAICELISWPLQTIVYFLDAFLKRPRKNTSIRLIDTIVMVVYLIVRALIISVNAIGQTVSGFAGFYAFYCLILDAYGSKIRQYLSHLSDLQKKYSFLKRQTQYRIITRIVERLPSQNYGLLTLLESQKNTLEALLTSTPGVSQVYTTLCTLQILRALLYELSSIWSFINPFNALGAHIAPDTQKKGVLNTLSVFLANRVNFLEKVFKKTIHDGYLKAVNSLQTFKLGWSIHLLQGVIESLSRAISNYIPTSKVVCKLNDGSFATLVGSLIEGFTFQINPNFLNLQVAEYL